MAKVRSIHPSFTHLVPVRIGSRPETGYNGNQLRTTVRFGVAMVGDRPVHVNLSSSVPTDSVLTLLIADNDFSGGRVQITLDEQYTLTSGLDFLIGATADDTATNLSNAVNTLPGFSATAATNSVDIYTNGLRATYLLKHMGTVENILADPNDGFFRDFDPDIEGAEIT